MKEAKGLGEDQREQSATVTHFGETSNYVRALAACAAWPSLKTITVMCQNHPRLQEINNAVSTLIEVLHSNPQLERIDLTHLELSLNHEIEQLYDAIRQHPGLSQLVRMNNSVQSIARIPYSYAAKLIDDLTANPDSHLKYLDLSSNGEFRVTIPGDAVMRLIQILNERNHGDFRFSNDYQSGVSFNDMQQADQLLEVARSNLQCVISLEVLAIGNENRYTDKGDYNPLVKSYQDKLNAIRDRNVAVMTAYYDQNRNEGEEKQLVLPEMVYLHHQAKYEEMFGERPKDVYPVSLKARTWFQLFKQNPKELPVVDETSMKQANERILNDKSRYKL